jgi:hypothetical protein
MWSLTASHLFNVTTKDFLGVEHKLLIDPDWPYATRFRVRMVGERRVDNVTHLVQGSQNIRSNTGDDMRRKAHAVDSSSGFNPLSRKISGGLDGLLEAVKKASATKLTKAAEEIAAKKAKEDAKAERERLKEEEKERVRQQKLKEKELSNQLKRDQTGAAAAAQTTTFRTVGAANAVAKKNALGTKRYQTVATATARTSKQQKTAMLCVATC